MTHGTIAPADWQNLVTVRPGPCLHVWRNGAEFAVVPLTHRAALNLIGSLTAAMQASDAPEVVRADLPPKVKPLKWLWRSGDICEAQTPWGKYFAQWDDELCAFFASLELGEHEDPIILQPQDVASMSEAQAAAQADYETRILAALVQPKSDLPTVDELAAIIRMVDGNHDMGADALARAIIRALNFAGAVRSSLVQP